MHVQSFKMLALQIGRLANSKFARFCFKLKHADTLSGKAHPHDVQAACKIKFFRASCNCATLRKIVYKR